MMQRCNHLHGKRIDLGDVEVLAPHQPMHVKEVYKEITIIFQLKVLLRDLNNEIFHLTLQHAFTRDGTSKPPITPPR